MRVKQMCKHMFKSLDMNILDPVIISTFYYAFITITLDEYIM